MGSLQFFSQSAESLTSHILIQRQLSELGTFAFISVLHVGVFIEPLAHGRAPRYVCAGASFRWDANLC